MKSGVGPTSKLVVAVSVTSVPTGTGLALGAPSDTVPHATRTWLDEPRTLIWLMSWLSWLVQNAWYTTTAGMLRVTLMEHATSGKQEFSQAPVCGSKISRMPVWRTGLVVTVSL